MHDIRIPSLRLPVALLSAVDDYRFENRLPSRAEAFRQIIEAGVQAKAVPTLLGTQAD
jgi:metal-responsive CopG/Arc/MetJ family transcriptional regulator